MTPLTRAEIEARQFDGLRALRAALVLANRFYAPRLDVDFQQRVAGQLAHPPSGANRTSPADPCTRFGQTSRTSGSAPRWFDAPRSEARA